MIKSRWCAVFLVLAAGVLVSPAAAQFHEADEQASKAFQAVVDAYRKRDGLLVKTKVVVEVGQDDQMAKGPATNAKFIIAPNRVGRVELNGYRCWLSDGMVQGLHEATDHSYFSTSDDGSPYYTLMSEFVDIPFPHLAIAFGEDSLDDICMQLHPKAPWIRPTSVETFTRNDRELQRIIFTSDHSTMHMDVVPESKLIDRVELTITSGFLVEQGARMVYVHEYDYEILDKSAVAEAMAFDPGTRQQVDMLATLLPEPDRAEIPEQVWGGMVGEPAPDWILATADGDALDLEDLRGQVVVLDFWATWCGPCIRALPLLHDVAKWARAEQLPVRVVTINVFERDRNGDATPDARLQTVTEFWKKHGFSLPVAMDYTDETAAAYGVQGIPAMFVIRADGVIHAHHVGIADNYLEQVKSDVTGAIEALEAGQ